MCSGFEPRFQRAARSVAIVAVLAVASPGVLGAVLAPDSLTKRQKQTINSLAESKLQEYMSLLEGIAFLSGSDEDALFADELITAAVKGDDRTFNDADAIIESNIDPDLRADALSRNRKAQEYLNDFKLLFRKDGDPAVGFKLLLRAEPRIIGGVVSTSLLYESTLNGHNESRPGTSYKRFRRVAEMKAEEKGAGSWRVTIMTDAFYDSTRAFVQFSVDRDLAALKQGTIVETPELVALREAEAAEQKALAELAAKKKKAYEDAIKAGKDAVAAGDFDGASLFYQEARKLDPVAFEPLLLSREAETARKIKQQRDDKEFNELMTKGKTLRGMHEYARALDSYQHAAAIFPNDPRPKPMIDSLDAMVKTKADRERFLEAKDYTASLGEAQRLLKLPGLQEDPDIRVLQARSYDGLNRRSDAINVLNEVVRKYPYHAEALWTMAEILRTAKDPAERAKAIPHYTVLMNRDVWDVRSYHHYAMLRCVEMKQCKEAVDVLRSALQREPGNAQTLYLLGRVNSVDGFKQYPDALGYLDEAITRDSVCGKCWLERGIVLLETDSFKAAERAIARARSLSLEKIYVDRADSMAARNYRQALALVAMKGRSVADPIFLRACVLAPDQAGYRLEKARNLIILEKYAEAIVDLDLHIEKTPAPYLALLDRAHCKVKTGRFAEARADVTPILDNHVEIYAENANLVAGQAAYYMGDMGPAEAHLKETLKLNKKNAKANQFMTLISLNSKRLDDAKFYGSKAVDLDPNAENHMNLGRALQAAKDVGGSVSSFNEALRLGAETSEVEKEIGRSYYLGGKYKQALEHFAAQKLLKDDKEVPPLAADCYFKLERYTDAAGELNLLLAQHPEVEADVTFVSRFAYLYVVTGELNLAKSYLDKAAAMDRSSALQNKEMQLAKVAYDWKNGDKPAAAESLRVMVQDRRIVSEKEVKEMPVLQDVISDRLWKTK